MIELYYWPTPNGHKISIALEELNLRYKVVPVNIGKGEQYETNFLKFSPNNRIPAIIDYDGPNGQLISIFDSGAILLYLAEKTSKLMPSKMLEKKVVYEWLMWQMSGFGPMLGQAHHFNFYAKIKNQYSIDRYSNEANRLYQVLDTQLSKNKYVAGNKFTIADISILPWSRSYEKQNVDIEKYKNVVRWRNELGKRPAVIRGMKVGSEYREDLKKLSESEWMKLFG